MTYGSADAAEVRAITVFAVALAGARGCKAIRGRVCAYHHERQRRAARLWGCARGLRRSAL